MAEEYHLYRFKVFQDKRQGKPEVVHQNHIRFYLLKELIEHGVSWIIESFLRFQLKADYLQGRIIQRNGQSCTGHKKKREMVFQFPFISLPEGESAEEVPAPLSEMNRCDFKQKTFLVLYQRDAPLDS